MKFTHLSIARNLFLRQPHLTKVRVVAPGEVKAHTDQQFEIHAASIGCDKLGVGYIAVEVPAENALAMSRQ